MWSANVEDGAAPAPSAAQLASSAVRLATTHYRALLSAVGVVLVPSLVVGAAALGFWRSRTYTGARGGGLAVAAEVAGVAVVVLGNFLAQAAGVHAATSAVVGARPDWRASCRAALRQWRAVVGSGLAVGLLAGLGLVLFVLPGIVLWLTWYVTMPVVVMEGATTRGALRRSASLVNGRRTTILGAFLLVEVLVIACSLPIGAIAGAAFSHSRLAEVIAEQVAAYAVEILLTPLQVALVLIVYLELRLRHDRARPAEVARAAGIAVSGAAGRPPAAGATDAPSLPGRSPGPSAPPSPAGGQPVAGPGSPGWPAVSPKPSQDRPARFLPTETWPRVSPKPPPPERRARTPAPDAGPQPSAPPDEQEP